MSLKTQRLVAILSLTFLAGGAAGYLAGHRTPRDVAASTRQALDGEPPATASQHRAEGHTEPNRDTIERTAEATLAEAWLRATPALSEEARERLLRQKN